MACVIDRRAEDDGLAVAGVDPPLPDPGYFDEDVPF